MLYARFFIKKKFTRGSNLVDYELINIFEKVRDQFVVVAVTLNSENTYGLYRTELGLESFKAEMSALFTARESYLNRKRKYVTDIETYADYLLYNPGSLDTDHPIKEALLELNVYYVDQEGVVYDVTVDRDSANRLTFGKERLVGVIYSTKARLYLQGMIRREGSANEMKYTTLEIELDQINEFSSGFTDNYFKWAVNKKLEYNQDGTSRKKRKNMTEVKKEDERISKLTEEYDKCMRILDEFGVTFNNKKGDRFNYVCVEFGTYVDENGNVYEIKIGNTH